MELIAAIDLDARDLVLDGGTRGVGAPAARGGSRGRVEGRAHGVGGRGQAIHLQDRDGEGEQGDDQCAEEDDQGHDQDANLTAERSFVSHELGAMRDCMAPSLPGSLNVKIVDHGLHAAHAARRVDDLVDVGLRLRMTAQGHDCVVVDGDFHRERLFGDGRRDLAADVGFHRLRVDFRRGDAIHGTAGDAEQHQENGQGREFSIHPKKPPVTRFIWSNARAVAGSSEFLGSSQPGQPRLHQRAAEEEHGQCREAQEDAERECELHRAIGSARHQREADERTGERREEQDGEQGLPSEHGADHRHHLHVAEAHPFDLADELVCEADREDHTAADRRAGG